MKKLLSIFFDRAFRKFVLVGVVNTIFVTAIMFTFYNVLRFSYWISSASNYFFGSILSYILNRMFTFHSGVRVVKTLPRFVLDVRIPRVCLSASSTSMKRLTA